MISAGKAARLIWIHKNGHSIDPRTVAYFVGKIKRGGR
jgi:hypothetical protein